MFSIKYLRWIDLNITDLCNLRCTFCPRSDAEVWANNNEHMSLELIKKITDDLIAGSYRQALSYTGRGESTLHESWDEAFAILNRKDRTYVSNLTTNGRNIDKLWDKQLKHLDSLTVNTYTTREEYERRKEKFVYLHNGRQVRHLFKPDDEKKQYNFTPNNRTGLLYETPKEPLDEVCMRPIVYIFVNFDGTYELCCNDWKYKTKIADLSRHNILEVYQRSKDLALIRWDLMQGYRGCAKACSECDATGFNRAEYEAVWKEEEQLQFWEKAKYEAYAAKGLIPAVQKPADLLSASKIKGK